MASRGWLPPQKIKCRQFENKTKQTNKQNKTKKQKQKTKQNKQQKKNKQTNKQTNIDCMVLKLTVYIRNSFFLSLISQKTRQNFDI